MTEEVIRSQPSTDDLFRILGSSRRRFVLRHLQDDGESVSVTDLSSRIAASECEDPSTEAVGAARTSLHHVHLPMLDDAGLVSYDPEAGTVRRRPWSASFRESLADVGEAVGVLRRAHAFED